MTIFFQKALSLWQSTLKNSLAICTHARKQLLWQDESVLHHKKKSYHTETALLTIVLVFITCYINMGDVCTNFNCVQPFCATIQLGISKCPAALRKHPGFESQAGHGLQIISRFKSVRAADLSWHTDISHTVNDCSL